MEFTPWRCSCFWELHSFDNITSSLDIRHTAHMCAEVFDTTPSGCNQLRSVTDVMVVEFSLNTVPGVVTQRKLVKSGHTCMLHCDYYRNCFIL